MTTTTKTNSTVRTAAAECELVFRSAVCSRTSPSHRENGDAWFVSEDTDLVVVADGMGGTNNGVSASQLVCDSLIASLELSSEAVPSNLTGKLSDALWRASRQIRRTKSLATVGAWSPGSTVVLGVRTGSQFLVKSVGDARAYLVRNGMATQLTADQTVDGILTGLGGRKRSLTRNLKQQTLLSFLGQHDFVPNDEVRLVTLRPSDRLVFCTDGVSSDIDIAQLGEIVSQADSADAAAEQLIDFGMSHSVVDDATCVVVFADEAGIENIASAEV